MTYQATHRTSWLQLATKRHILRGALQVSAVVGAVLNVVNQGEAMLNGQPLAWGRVAMNFAVPFCVAAYSAVRNERSHLHRTGAATPRCQASVEPDVERPIA